VATLTTEEIRKKYDRFARWYDLVEGIPDVLGVTRLRRRLLDKVRGDVLEVSAGTGKNFRYYASVRRVIASDLSEVMLARARAKAEHLPLSISFIIADAEVLPFGDQAFDTVVSTLTICTFPDPINALKEMARVCRPGGKILLLEHGRSDREWLGRLQDRRAERYAKQLGCHWNREPLVLLRQAGLQIGEARRVFFGVFHEISVEPGKGQARFCWEEKVQ
jgi:ubiquinone/menaquinone biosynthesis C-methylase UbiE